MKIESEVIPESEVIVLTMSPKEVADLSFFMAAVLEQAGNPLSFLGYGLQNYKELIAVMRGFKTERDAANDAGF